MALTIRPTGSGRRARPDGRLSTGLPPDPLWYRDAIIYELHVRAFRDSNGDGKGDFEGLTEKLDYLADLGVTAVWVLPFYPSPLRDDGYDIADYTNVHPDYGTMRDVRTFIREAHARGLRVITELVCNHTSDQHPWFQRARRAPVGSAARDFYVWSDTTDRYRDARIIFKDFESSNWTWDREAGAYFWHRFYSHQPDLNFDDPRVHRALFGVMDDWLELGVDGLRLDAVPYLYEREGTSGENLPETHEFLKALRGHIDARFADRMLLAEANQWPEDSVAYFGEGDECHMAFNFPVMPRMFMAIQQEDRYPIVDILAQTPPPPDGSQWALFLRNHDELTLEMVTDEERDYMYRVYARDPQARLNLGIRRRLAPLLNNNRRRIELMNGLLFSLPGTPVIYYGDEIGMGDNIYLGDRNGVRTPMQWSGDRNAGFSDANRQRLYLPVIVDPEYHYEAVNVQTQQANPHSLLWWTKRLIALRKRHPAFGRGSIEFLHPDNRRILAFVRRDETESILVVANLSRFVQYAEIDLSAYEGQIPVEMFGRSEFPPVRQAPYPLTLGPHAFLWFELTPAPAPIVVETASPAETAAVPYVRDLGRLAAPPVAGRLAAVLARWIPARRWFRSKARTVRSVDIADVLPLGIAGDPSAVLAVTVGYTVGEPETYLVPVSALTEVEASTIAAEAPDAVIARLVDDAGGTVAVLVDGMRAPTVGRALVEAIGHRRRLHGRGGELVGRVTRAYPLLRGPAAEPLAVTTSRIEQSNSSIVLGDRLMLKLYRRVEPGVSPDLEIGELLTARGYPYTPAVAGGLDYRFATGERGSAAILMEFVPNEGDMWSVTTGDVAAFLERSVVVPDAPPPASGTTAALLALAATEPTDAVRERIGPYLETAALMGTRIGELHMALGLPSTDPSVAPEAFTGLYARSVYQSMWARLHADLRLLEQHVGRLPAGAAAAARAVLAGGGQLERRYGRLSGRAFGGQRTRIHGDLHLGQILSTGRDVLVIDFEGEPGRAIGERRLKRSPLVDVAGMLRSFDYAAGGSTVRPDSPAGVREEDRAAIDRWARYWATNVSAAFLRAYRAATAGAPFLPASENEWEILLDAYVLDKALYELEYELNNRPEWVTIPIEGILRLLEG
ncbi:MAG TPA: maltose alpha-D-glucosyltransferase [Candidatus Limnocylindrales bacterium]|nr:maltose alpha-D-glucosyltransferase [Candidatus Limnocylindrales bacterium]